MQGNESSASNEAPAEKPPTIRVGVQGFVAFEAVPSAINWAHLVELPPFQMYAVERSGKAPGEVMAWLPEFMNEQGAKLGEQGLYDDYCQWHAAKGYWPKEDPTGRVVE